MLTNEMLLASLLGCNLEELNRWQLAASLEGDRDVFHFIRRVANEYMDKEITE